MKSARPRTGRGPDHGSETPPDLILLDWKLEGLAGIEVCVACGERLTPRTLRSDADGEGRGSRSHPGPRNGADDYVTKPFSPRAAGARRGGSETRPARLGRAGAQLRGSDDGRGELQSEAGRCDPELGPTEYRLLKHFMEHPGRVFSREQLWIRSGGGIARSRPERSTFISGACAAPSTREAAPI
jgi:two-component system phosphate regulon response regulator PhoB